MIKNHCVFPKCTPSVKLKIEKICFSSVYILAFSRFTAVLILTHAHKRFRRAYHCLHLFSNVNMVIDCVVFKCSNRQRSKSKEKSVSCFPICCLSIFWISYSKLCILNADLFFNLSLISVNDYNIKWYRFIAKIMIMFRDKSYLWHWTNGFDNSDPE